MTMSQSSQFASQLRIRLQLRSQTSSCSRSRTPTTLLRSPILYRIRSQHRINPSSSRSRLIAFEDVDGDLLTYTALRHNDQPLPLWLTFDGSTRTFSGTPENADIGKLQVKVTAQDPSLASVDDIFDIDVSDVNDPPSFTSTPVTGATQGSPYSYVAAATDPDGNALTFSESSPLPSWLTLTNNGNGTATLSGTPANGDVGPNGVDLQVSDGTLTDTQSFTITVANINDPPSFTSTPVTVATEDSPYTYAVVGHRSRRQSADLLRGDATSGVADADRQWQRHRHAHPAHRKMAMSDRMTSICRSAMGH